MKVSYRTNGKAGSTNAVVVMARTREFLHERPDEPFAALPWEDRDALIHAIVGDLVEQAAGTTADIIIAHPAEESFDDIVALFPGRIRAIPLPPEAVTRGPGFVLDADALRSYQKIILIVEQTPLVSSRLIAKTFAQLGAEDDCIVLGQNREGGCAYLGVRAPQRALVADLESELFEKSDRLLAHLCGQNIIVVPIPSLEGLRTGSQVALLRDVIGTLPQDGSLFPRRTDALFRTFEKKYKRRKQPQ